MKKYQQEAIESKVVNQTIETTNALFTVNRL